MIRLRKRLFLYIGLAVLVLYSLCLYISIPSNKSNDFALHSSSSQKNVILSQNRRCPLELGHSADVSMFNLYKELKFDNIDGGVWKQGWNIQVNRQRWNSNNNLKVFVVPHSHNDPGWKKTFEQYYESQTRQIFNNMISKMTLEPSRKFIWAEVSYLSLWWNEASDENKQIFKNLLHNGQIEIVSGGWVMPDEANSHYYSMIQQLTHGHQWLDKHLKYKPKHSWCIDPFGTSPTMPFLLQQFDLQSLVIQRTHYSVKKYLAKHKQLEFRWRQLWDTSGQFDFLTHMMPFYIYDIPHTCGPDPAICCQFDFRRSYTSSMICPWKKQPQLINEVNVAERAATLLDQYRKKAELFSTNVLLVPLGDDFRYDEPTEWDLQFENYRRLFDYMNSNPSWFVEANFGTLEDYFSALAKEQSRRQFPSLTGDFFTYSDRDDHYWSGYYTSRPYYKKLDRELISHLRAAEILYLLAWKSCPLQYSSWLLSGASKFASLLDNARASLSLFQHHDGITGTAKDYVVKDYANKLNLGIEGSQYVMQQSLNFLLSADKETYQPNYRQIYFDIAKSKRISSNDLKFETVKVSDIFPTRRIVIFNSLTWKRTEIVSIKVESESNIQLCDENLNPVPYQINPFCDLTDNSINGRCFLLHFKVVIEPLSVITFFLLYTEKFSNNQSKASVSILNNIDVSMNLFLKSHSFPLRSPPSADFSIENSRISVIFRPNGLMKAITLKKFDLTVPVHLNFVKYSCKIGKEMCGAYLFLPDGPCTELKCENPFIKLIEGSLMSTVIVFCDFVIHAVHVYKDLGPDEYGVEIQNLVDVKTQNNFEIAMKLSTNIRNNGLFYTDVNGLQMIKREYHSKLPIQANYYPMPTSIYIEDDQIRLSLVSAQPLGASSLSNGEIEVMQDRRLMQDDNLGLGQGVTDNRPVLHLFRLVLDKRTVGCQKTEECYTGGYLSLMPHLALNSILYPLVIFINEDLETNNGKLLTSFLRVSIDQEQTSKSVDIHLVSVNTKPEASAFGIIFHRTDLDTCFDNEFDEYFFSDGLIKVNSYIPVDDRDEVHRSSLSFLNRKKKLNGSTPETICPMEFVAFNIQTYYDSIK